MGQTEITQPLKESLNFKRAPSMIFDVIGAQNGLKNQWCFKTPTERPKRNCFINLELAVKFKFIQWDY